MGLGKGLSKLFLGKTTTVNADPEAEELRGIALKSSRAGSQGLEQLMQRHNKPVNEIAAAQIGQNVAAEKANLEDQRRTIQQNIARRGLQNTSIGLGSLLGAQRNSGRNISQLLASQPMLQDQMLADRSKELIQAGQAVSSYNNVPVRFRDEKTASTGLLPGLMQAGGSLVGGFFGGQEGAKAGGASGASMGTSLSETFRR